MDNQMKAFKQTISWLRKFIWTNFELKQEGPVISLTETNVDCARLTLFYPLSKNY